MNLRSGCQQSFVAPANNENRNFASLSFKERAPTYSTYDSGRPQGLHLRAFGRDISNIQDVKARPDSSNPAKFATKRKYQAALARAIQHEKGKQPPPTFFKPVSTSPPVHEAKGDSMQVDTPYRKKQLGLVSTAEKLHDFTTKTLQTYYGSEVCEVDRFDISNP